MPDNAMITEGSMMSIPETMLEEPPDPEWCDEHHCPRRCAACEADAADRAYDSAREDR